MKKILPLLLFFCLSVLCYSQTQKLNQLDSLGKKNGVWIEYLNVKWKVLKDSSRAVYWGYNYYDHGDNTFRIAFGGMHRLHHKLEVVSNNNQKSRIKMLDGEYKWYDRRGRIVSVDSFANGDHVFAKYYAWEMFGSAYLFGYNKKRTGKLLEYDDYRKKYKDEPFTYYIERFDKKGNVSHYYTRKAKYGWMAYGYLP